ncbi:MAG: carboxymuconolactone decarboxylase family protein [Candidatus Limnocylindria bacterium]
MPIPRLAPLAPPYPPALAAALEAMMPPGVPPLLLFRTLAHNPRILEKIRASNLLDRGSIPRREREIVILRATARAGGEYEWGVHVAFFAAKVGLAQAQIDASVHGSPEDPAWSPRERLLVRLVDQLHDTARLDDALWGELAACFEPAQLIELVVLAGFYRTISCLVNGFAIALEEGAPRFPAR